MYDQSISDHELNNMRFTTKDNDNDRSSRNNCAVLWSSGWWFDACMCANLNGKNFNNGISPNWGGILWITSAWSTDRTRSLKTVTMAIRPRIGKHSFIDTLNTRFVPIQTF